MNWVHHHDPEGIPDYPNELPFDTRMPDCWTNDADVRIGFYGHMRGIATFTYKKGDLNLQMVKGPIEVAAQVTEEKKMKWTHQNLINAVQNVLGISAKGNGTAIFFSNNRSQL